MYSVNYWGSHPDADNDDCYAGEDFEDLGSALVAFYKKPDDPYYAGSVQFVELDGPDYYRLRLEDSYRPECDGNDDWKRECAMQSAMAHGCDGWNDHYG